ncbi:putative Histone chaperone domain-containing protein [Seiridium cardinale]|uniref:Histone chaperone domain-containing protein n=1 Tax=Seiridium cardinale TaxID=138064 RepID=A0ABR2XR25_9PEZI
MPIQQKDPVKTTAGNDPLEKSAAKQEKGPPATEGIVGEHQLDAAIGNEGDDSVAEQTSAADDPLETTESKKEDY